MPARSIGTAWGVLAVLSIAFQAAAFTEANAQEKAAEKAPPAAQEKAAEKGGEAPGEKAGAGLPAGVLARIDGREITVQDYVAYLFASVGKSKLKEFIDRLLLEEEAKRLEVAPPTEAEVEEKVNVKLDSAVRTLFQNNMGKFVENLAQRGLTLEDHKAKLRQDTAYGLLEERCILKTRKVTEEEIKDVFEKTYGEGGIQYELRHILISTRTRPQAPGEKGEKKAALAEGEAWEKANKILAELRAGADFVQLVKTYSDDELTKRNEGRIPYYQKGYRGKDFDAAVSMLTEENPISEVVMVPQGFEIIQLAGKKIVKLEEKREELLNLLKTRLPLPRERNLFLKNLREKAKIET